MILYGYRVTIRSVWEKLLERGDDDRELALGRKVVGWEVFVNDIAVTNQ